VQYDAVAGALEAQHGGGKQIARDCGHDVLCPQTSVSAVATAAIAPLPGRRVFEHDYLVFEIFDFNSWIRVGELAAARQFDEQVGAGALEQKSAAANYMFALAYGFPSGTIDGVPEFPNVGMCSAPVKLKLFDFCIGEPIRFKLAPSVQPALIA